MSVKVRFPIFVFTDYGYETCLSVRDFCIKSKREIDSGYFIDLEFLDSDGVLRKIKKIKKTKSIDVSFLLNLVKFCRMQAVEIIEIEHVNEISSEEIISKIVNSVCFVSDSNDEQFDVDELYCIIERKKSMKNIIEYFSGNLPDYIDEFQYI